MHSPPTLLIEIRWPWLLSCAALAIFGLAFLCFVIKVRSPEDNVLISIVRALAFLAAKCIHRLKVVRAGNDGDPLPASGGCIVVSNHRSGIDPVLLSVVTRRRIHFLMAREYFELPVLTLVFRSLGCIPVNRDGKDLSATKAALRALRAGEVVGIFPQGGIREAGASMEGKAGVALLALRTGAPVVPFYIDGSPNLASVFRAVLTPSHTVIRCGAPFQPANGSMGKPARDDLQNVTARIFDAIAALAADAGRGPIIGAPVHGARKENPFDEETQHR